MIATEKYLGEKYEFNGRGGPYDCLGLVLDVLADNGIYLPDDDGMKIMPDWMQDNPERLPEGLTEYCDEVSIEDREPLDIAVFVVLGIPRHAGVIIDNYRFIHIFNNSIVSISKFSRWKKKIHSLWRVR